MKFIVYLLALLLLLSAPTTATTDTPVASNVPAGNHEAVLPEADELESEALKTVKVENDVPETNSETVEVETEANETDSETVEVETEATETDSETVEVETEATEPKFELTFNSQPVGTTAPSITAPVHTHNIVAYEHAHWCTECDEYVPHDTEHMTKSNTPFFAVYTCEDCGYSFSERHSFVTCHDGIDGHYKVCRRCGYTTKYEPHNYEDRFSATRHYLKCSDCGYVAAEHYGVNFDAVDGDIHVATCERCGVHVEEKHTWDGLECDRCDYIVPSNMNFGIVGELYDSDGELYMNVLVEDNLYKWVKVPKRSYGMFDEGDLVLIGHHEGNVYDVCTFVDGKVVEAPQNFYDYFPDAKDYDFPEGLTLEDVTVADVIEFTNNNTSLVFEDFAVEFNRNYVVTYNMVTMETMDITDLEAGDQVIWFNGALTWVVLIIG